ncbi:MAG: hypothetical protein IPO27_13035 [Bacteroidetes bacterium]|nr:hypothetical protein [Bacteroidota bacterium]
MKFSQILANLHTKEHLINSATTGRISHAQLFHAFPGTGALAMALAYAQFINCLSPIVSDSCGTCSSCIKYEKLSHPDLHFIFPVANTEKIKDAASINFIETWRKCFLANPYFTINDWLDQIDVENRQLSIKEEEATTIIRNLSYKSFEAKLKVCIIWMAEKMSVITSNKLLKVLEEPPDNTLFILIAENTEKLLPTIISRTQLVYIPKPDDDMLKQWMLSKKNISAVEANRIIRLCDSNISAIGQALQNEEFDFPHEEKFLEWMRVCLRPLKKAKELVDMTNELAELKREGIKQFLIFSIETVRECLIFNHGAKNLQRFNDEVFKNFSVFAPYITQNNIEGFTKELTSAYNQIERNANPKILFYDLTFKLASLIVKK